MASLADELRLEDPDFFVGDPHPVLRRLREEAPLFYYEPLDMWVVSTYGDVRKVGSSPALFTSNDGILLNDFRYGDIVKSFFPANAENFALLDPPRHNDHRRIMIPPFGPQAVTRMESAARQLCVERLNKIQADEPVNWSELIAEPFPLIVIALLIGLPIEDLDRIKEWSDAIVDMSAATDAEGLAAIAGSLEPMGIYFEEKLAERRENPQEDLLTTLELARAAGKISNETVHMMLAGIMTAGNETTRNTMNGALIALAEHPAEMAKLTEDPTRVKRAVEEFLRWVTPVRGFGRTLTQDTEIRSTKLTEGQRIFMLYAAANRDPDAFPDPDVFAVDRAMEQQQLSFGFGQHVCIGAGLARMELRVLFEELVQRFSSVTVNSQSRLPSRLINAWTDVTVTFQN
ncbi:cytochrome P450 [Streptomyces odonnellii]|uniref:cytochrome P450 n=1 Tax=Streptomyces odonnellii TaxID=1417980 RepID=UPI000625F885|nr:cytochrome P450 [Streptomyces odonnellii]